MGTISETTGLLLVALVLAGGCALAGPPGGGPGDVAARPVTAADEGRASDLLSQARTSFDAGRLDAAREASEEIVGRYSGTSAYRSGLWLLARVAFAQGDYEVARERAEQYAELSDVEASEAALELAAAARSALESGGAREGVLAAILPNGGGPALQQASRAILDGIRLAVEDERQSGGRDVELAVFEDTGDAERNAQLIREIESRGVVGIVGPLLAPALTTAARARSNPNLVLVSPTAPEGADAFPNVYSLGTVNTQVPETLASYAINAGLYEVAIIYPRTPEFQRQARAFEAALRNAGGRVVADLPYRPGTTTFATELEGLARGNVRALFIAAPEQDLRQLAPQVHFYGLSAKGVEVLGGETWAREEVQRLIDARFLEGVVVATPFPPSSPEVGWSEFVERYESTYRRTLENHYPALGYDAANLVLNAYRSSSGTAADVSRQLAATQALRGVTGIFSVQGGVLTGRPFLMRFQNGQLVPIPTRAP